MTHAGPQKVSGRAFLRPNFASGGLGGDPWRAQVDVHGFWGAARAVPKYTRVPGCARYPGVPRAPLPPPPSPPLALNTELKGWSGGPPFRGRLGGGSARPPWPALAAGAGPWSRRWGAVGPRRVRAPLGRLRPGGWHTGSSQPDGSTGHFPVSVAWEISI